jgi:16S rRNA (uracil1498-N3)-methyltransferase
VNSVQDQRVDMADRFFVDGPLEPGHCELRGAEAHHLATVRRFDVGDRIVLFNGDGCEYSATIESVSKRSVMLAVEVGVIVNREPRLAITVAAAMPKGDRGEFLIEKLTELGTTLFVPLDTQHAVAVPDAAKIDKLRRIVIEASKQCGRNTLMTIAPAMAWSALVATAESSLTRIILHTDTSPALSTRLVAGAVMLAIGPEGGFTAAEIEAALNHGWQRASLGRAVLRIETAAIAAVAVALQAQIA